MIPLYLEKLQEFAPLSEASRVQLQQQISVVSVSKGEHILENQDICHHIYYIHSGFARQYYFKNGKDITEWFAGSGEFCFSITSYFENEPSNLVIEAVENSTVIQLHRNALLELSKTNSEIAQLAISMISRSLIFSQERMNSVLFETALDRYKYLLKTKPAILNKVALAHVASYLGITQETLSRIRAKI